MRVFKFNEEVGFDDEEMRDRLEIPNLRGELEPGSPDMRTYSKPVEKTNTRTEIKKILFKYPILEKFFTDSKRIEGSELISFYATSKEPVEGVEYYTQLSFAFHDGQYYVGSILRDRFAINEADWVKHTFFFDEVSHTLEVTDAFLQCCRKLGIFDQSDMQEYISLFN